MKTFTYLVWFGCGAVGFAQSNKAPATTTPAPAPPPLVITGATVIDVRSGSRTPNATIVIRGGRIDTVDPSPTRRPPAGATIVNASGKFVIPGLWDLHTHIQNREELAVFFPLLIAHGVLGLRDMGGMMPKRFAEFGARQTYRPQVIACGSFLAGSLANRAGDAEVDRAADAGAEFIKALSMPSREELVAIVRRARERGLHVAGHAPLTFSAADASDAGMRTMEHLFEIHVSASTQESEIRAERLRLAPQVSGGNLTKLIAFPPLDQLLESWSDAKADAMFRRFVANQTWHVPTLVLFQAWAETGGGTFWKNDHLRYVPESWRETWRPDEHRWLKDVAAADRPVFFAHVQRWLRAQIEVTRRMHRAGVRFLAGTDASQ
jgi:hypothetical protein